jgi:hypothetical protein
MIDLSNPYVIFGIVLFVVILVVGIVYLAIPYLIKKGYPIDKYLAKADKGLDSIQDTVSTVSKVVPIPYIDLIEKIFTYADISVHSVEQLYKIGKIDKDARKEEAKDYINNALTLIGVEITPELEKVIEGAIQGTVSLLPKTHTEETK